MSVTKQKYWNGRKVKSEKIITRGPNVEFGALYEAMDFLRTLFMRVGYFDENNPIGFSHNPLSETYGFIPKWSNLSKEDKAKLDGVIVSEDFKTKNVKIIFFI